MLLVRGHAGGQTLTGTIYERGEESPTFQGAPNEDAPYVWLCDEFYEVESGGPTVTVEGTSVHIAFETPMPRGFETKKQALAAAKDHLRTQFARIGVREADVGIETEKARP